MKKPKIKKTDEICSTKFLSLKQSTYNDKECNERKWDYVTRSKDASVVTIIAFDATMRKILFIKQPRIPIGKIILSFPAGLIDPGESVENAARRELLEETGYKIKKILSKSPSLPKSAGLTNESTYQVQCVVVEKPGSQKLEKTEDIKVFWMTPKAFYKKGMLLDENKYAIEDETWNFVSGIVRAKKYKV